ncbi:MAG TPA: M48 family metallopeptidase [Burkholderiales bacterium]|nr:M48 family metallopeptidase [Burkholderiales bacterium]
MNLEIALDRISADARIGDVRRTLSLPGGAQLQTDDHAALAVLFPQANRLEVWVHKLEQHRLYVVGAFVTIAVFSWWSMVYGVPLAAKTVTRWMPRQVETVLGDQSLASIDKTVCSPSGLPAGRQQQLRSGFSALTSGLDDRYSYRLEFRDCRRIGPNAFALPGGTIVITDSLIELATDDRQITAVLAHEIGHVRNRHGLRLVLQGAGAAALISTLAGDAVSITALAAALPTLLLETGYSREFETEADTYAFKRLKEIGLSPKYFADMLTRLQTAHSEKQKAADKSGNGRSENNRVFDYLSTHPDTAERIQRALDAQ